MPPSRKYLKMPILAAVEFSQACGTVETLEGTVRYEAGDALMTGVEGECWPIARSRFEKTYEPVSELRMGEDGLYRKHPIVVAAVQTESDMVIALDLHNTELLARPGDWIVTAPDGEQWVVAQEIFLKTYVPVEEAEEKQ